MRVLGVIPARCGSKRIPHKNLQEVGGVPLVCLALQDTFDVLGAVVVSTDCIGVVHALGSRYLPLVMERECGPDGPTVDVLLEVLNREPAPLFDAVVCLQPTSPFRTGEDIDACLQLLEQGARSVVSVNQATGERNGAVYVTRVEMLRDGLIYDEHSVEYAMPAERSLDINEPADLELARNIAAERGW